MNLSTTRIAQEVGVSRPAVIVWRERFRQGGPESLTKIAPGRGRPVTYDADRVKQIIEATTQTKPAGATHWSTRTMAKAQGVGKDTGPSATNRSSRSQTPRAPFHGYRELRWS